MRLPDTDNPVLRAVAPVFVHGQHSFADGLLPRIPLLGHGQISLPGFPSVSARLELLSTKRRMKGVDHPFQLFALLIQQAETVG